MTYAVYHYCAILSNPYMDKEGSYETYEEAKRIADHKKKMHHIKRGHGWKCCQWYVQKE